MHRTNNSSIKAIAFEFRQSLLLSLPLIASNLVQSSSGFIGTIMIAHLGENALAASALVWSIFITLCVFSFGIFAAVSVLVSQNFGAKNNEGIRLAVSQGFVLAIIFSIPAMLIMWFAPIVFKWSGQSQEVAGLATSYLHAIVWCILPLAFLIVMEQFLIGISRTRLVLVISLLQIPCEIIANYAFIFGKFGMPKCGIAGLGYGFTLVFILAAIVIGFFLYKSKRIRTYQVFSRFGRINGKYLWELIRVGFPIGCMYTIEMCLFLVLVFLIGRLGSDVLAAHQIAWQYLSLTITIVFAISQAATVRIGQAVGRNDKPAVLLAAYVNMLMSFVFMLMIAGVYIGFPHLIISIDIDVNAPKYAKVVAYAVKFLMIAGIFQLFDSIRLVSVGALRGLKDTKAPMYISIFAFWCVALPCAYYFGFFLHGGGAGIWWGLVAGIGTGAIILVIRFRTLVKKVQLKDLLI